MSKKQASSVGMMEGAFFVGRQELLNWVNQLLLLNLEKVEQCANGAVYCQILDCVYPFKVPMKKVNWLARMEHEFIPNYKLLQMAFNRLSIQRHIDVDKLIRAKYQDNLEFLQWMKCFWDNTCPIDQEYSPHERRPPDSSLLPAWAQSGPEQVPRPRVANEDKSATTHPETTTQRRRSGREREVQEIDDLQAIVEGLENERDYYFNKLRNIEIFTQNADAEFWSNVTVKEVVRTVQKMLYKEETGDETADGAEDVG